MDDLEFGFELVDEASSPAAKIHHGLDQLEQDLDELDKASGEHMGAVGEHFDGAGVATHAFGETIGEVAADVIEKAADMAFEIAKFAGEAALDFGKASVEAAAFRERFELAFQMLRHGEDGVAQFDRIKDLAIQMGTPLEDTVEQFQKLAAMQFPEQQAEQFFLRMQDLRAVGASAEEAQQALFAITQIKAAGKLQGNDLLQLANAGVSVQLVMQALATDLGTTTDKVAELKEAGKITSDMALKAIDEAIGKKTGAAVAGDAGKKFADSTISGMSSRIANIGGVIEDDIGQHVAPAFLELRPVLDDVFAGLQSDQFQKFLGSAGDAVQEIVKGLLDLKPVVADVMNGLTGTEAQAVLVDIGHGIHDVLDAARDAWPVVKAFLGGMGDGVEENMKALSEIAGGIEKAFGGGQEADMQQMADAARELGHSLGELLVDFAAVAGAIAAVIGVGMQVDAWFVSVKKDVDDLAVALGVGASNAIDAFVEGLVQGIEAGKARVAAAVSGLGLGSLTTLAGVLGIHSPSAETEWIAQMMGAGMSKGAAGAVPNVARAMGELGGAALGALPGADDAQAFPAPGAQGGGAFPPMPTGPTPPPIDDPIRIPAPQANSISTRGDTNLNVDLTQHIQGGHDAKATGDHAADKGKRALVNELERFAAELGN